MARSGRRTVVDSATAHDAPGGAPIRPPPDPGDAGLLTTTFLFSDIEGSTRLVRQVGSDYAELLEVHRRLLRHAIGSFGGQEVGTQGDSLFAVFPSPRHALAAAVAGQRALAAHPWPPGRQIRVRMGLHTGEAVRAAGDYVGLEVHRAARIAAAAHGGQVVVSEATAILGRDALPDGTGLRDLGRHRLKDFGLERIYQLDVRGLETRFPALHSLAGPAALPVALGEVIGRDGDVAAVVAHLTSGRRLVTLTGPGGIGKTRLAIEVAHAVEGTFPGGAVFVPLAGVEDPSLVLVGVADGLGARAEPGVDLVEQVVSALGEERTLLVLDNLEQVVDAATDVVAVLDRSEAATFLVTSRQVLRVRGEQEHRVPPLAPVDAVHLFDARAAAVRPGSAASATSAAAVQEIARRLDGLPLAIELAAARARLFAPDALLARLVQHADVLGPGPVDLPERQRTLRATMEWSHDLLDEHERALFARLAVFAGGWTVDAAEAVCGLDGDPPVIETLVALLEKSLLVAPDDDAPEPRMHMLETIRARAAEKLALRPERRAIEQRHTTWLVDLASHQPGLRGPDHRLWIERFDRERPNLRAVVARSLDGGDLETVARLARDTFGYLSHRDAEIEAIGWLDEALGRPVADPATRGRLLVTRALAATVFAEFDLARSLLAQAMPLVPVDADHALDRALAAMAEAYCATATDPPEEAAPVVERAAAELAAVGADLGRAHMVTTRGSIALQVGDLELAEHHYRVAAELGARMENDAIRGRALSLLGLAMLARGDVAGARGPITEGAWVNRCGGQRSSIAYSLEGLAAAALTEGRPDAAGRALAAAAATRQQLGQPPSRALAPFQADLAARIRAALGESGSEAAWAEGRSWDVRRALDDVMEAVDHRRAELLAACEVGGPAVASGSTARPPPPT
jgi:predicted ATPase/class 3 adenylate cyclase